jgi:hypothetical protein
MEQDAVIKNLTKQVKALKIYTAVLTVIVLAFTGLATTRNTTHFKEITTERLNIVEHNGRLRLVISNKESQHPGRMDNNDLPKRERPAGMIFFNDDGDECGGLVYDGDKRSASMTYSIDQYKNDQVMQLQYAQDNGDEKAKTYGLKLWDRSDSFTLTKLIAFSDSLKKLHDTAAYNTAFAKARSAGLLARQRLFVGKNDSGEVGLFLNDAQGKPRLKIYINKQNQPVIEKLSADGKIIATK